MKANWLPISAAVALALGSVTASAVDFHGFFRAGAQLNTQGGEVYCSGNGTSGHLVGRLADECDTYAEFVLSQEVYNKDNNKWTVNTLLAYGTTEGNRDLQGNSWQGVAGSGDTWSGQRSSLREVYAKYDTDSGYSIWAGKRYYQRKDIHILDLYYLNNSGHGAGIENIDVGMGNLNFAVIKWANTGKDGAGTDYNRNVYKIDARWNAIPLGVVGNLDASVIYGLPFISDKQKKDEDNKDNNRANQANSGALITLDLGSSFDGDDVAVMNHFVAQYGTNGFADIGNIGNHAGDNYTYDTHVQGVSLIDWGTLDAGNFGLGYSFIWAHLNSDKAHNQPAATAWTTKRSGWNYSIVIRPEYKWTEFTRTTLELGYSKRKTNYGNNDNNTQVVPKDDNKDPDLYKVTLAQQFTPGKGFWTRPAIRFYVSYLSGKQFGYRSKNDDKHNYQVTVGTQVEAFW